MARHASSILVASPKQFIAGYNQTVDGEAHNLADAGSIPAPATNIKPVRHNDAFGIPAGARTGKVTFEATRPDQSSRQA